MNRLAALLLIGTAAVAVSTCDSGPTAGDITFDLTTPNTNDGAIQFIAKATAPDSLTGVTAACTGCQVFTVTVSATEIRGVVTGDISGGALVHLSVTDAGKSDPYTMSVVAAASRTFVVQAGAYSLKPEK